MTFTGSNPGLLQAPEKSQTNSGSATAGSHGKSPHTRIGSLLRPEQIRGSSTRQRGLGSPERPEVATADCFGHIEVTDLTVPDTKGFAIFLSQPDLSQRSPRTDSMPGVQQQSRIMTILQIQHALQRTECPIEAFAGIQPVVIDGGGGEDGSQLLAATGPICETKTFYGATSKQMSG